MNIRDLDLLRQLVITNSYTQVSNEYKIHKSNLSKKITTIEKELGYTLFKRIRGKEGVEPTEKGKLFFEKSEGIVDRYYSLLEALENYPDLPRNFTIHTTNLVIEDTIVPIMPELLSSFKDLRIDFIARNSLISSQEKETLFTISPKSQENENFHQVDLQDFHVKLWASESYLKKNGCPKTLDDLTNHQLLVFAKKFDDKTYPSLNWFIDKIKVLDSNVICLNSSPALIKAASLGLGIISLAEESIHAHGIKLIPIPLLEKDLPKTITMSFSFPSHLKDNLRMQKLTTFFKDKFKKHYDISK